MEYQHLEIGRHGAVATLRFNRPAKANALSGAVLLEIEHAALAFRDDAATRAVIVTGAGKHFSSGADLTDPGPGKPEPLVLRRRRARYGERAIQALRGIDQITIAAWNGAAMGGGGCIALALDFRVGADDCFLQFPEIDLGMNLMWQSLPLVTQLVGPARAKRLVIGGDRIHADELEEWGVLDQKVPRASLLDAASALAERYAKKPPVAAQMIKRSVNHLVSALDRSIMHMDADQNVLTQTTDDRRAAGPAYLAKRDIEFTGN
jgi:enoyl-CoA hydratase/carnithine racemase